MLVPPAAASGADSNSPTACQCQLQELLGLDSLAAAGIQPCTSSVTVFQLWLAVSVCADCSTEGWRNVQGAVRMPAQVAEQQQQPQRQQYEQLLWLLLPTVLLPCASAVVSVWGLEVSAGLEGLEPDVLDLLEHCRHALFLWRSSAQFVLDRGVSQCDSLSLGPLC